jgi:Gas vesicle synthesis protein GvpL/GvpF
VERIHGHLSEHAVDAVLSRVQDRRLSGHEHEMVLNAAYLVPDARIADFQAAFGDVIRRHGPDGFQLELTGPWPAYHFAGGRATG